MNPKPITTVERGESWSFRIGGLLLCLSTLALILGCWASLAGDRLIPGLEWTWRFAMIGLGLLILDRLPPRR